MEVKLISVSIHQYIKMESIEVLGICPLYTTILDFLCLSFTTHTDEYPLP